MLYRPGWAGPPRGLQQFAHTLAQARAQDPQAEQALVELLADEQQPAIARATAASELQRWLSQSSVEELANALQDDSAQVRIAALQSLAPLPASARWQLLSPLLDDPERTVRAMGRQSAGGYTTGSAACRRAPAPGSAPWHFIANP